MKVIRRQFLKVSAGAIGTTVAADAAGLGVDTTAAQERAQVSSIKTRKQVPSICPFCSVGCGQIAMINDAGKIIDIQGNPDSADCDACIAETKITERLVTYTKKAAAKKNADRSLRQVQGLSESHRLL